MKKKSPLKVFEDKDTTATNTTVGSNLMKN